MAGGSSVRGESGTGAGSAGGAMVRMTGIGWQPPSSPTAATAARHQVRPHFPRIGWDRSESVVSDDSIGRKALRVAAVLSVSEDFREGSVELARDLELELTSWVGGVMIPALIGLFSVPAPPHASASERRWGFFVDRVLLRTTLSCHGRTCRRTLRRFSSGR